MQVRLYATPRWLVLPATAAAIMAVMLGTTTAASASTSPPSRVVPAAARITDGPIQITDATHPLVPIGARAPAADLRPATTMPPAQVPPVPTETVHGDVLALQNGAFYQVGTAQDRNVSISQCSGLFGGSTGNQVINEFAWCNDTNVHYDVLQGGKVIGRVTWFQVTAGNAASGRSVHLTTAMQNIVVTGEVVDGLLAVNWGAGGYSGSDGSNPPCTVTNDSSNPTLLSQWQAGGTARATVSSTSGYGRDQVARCEMQVFDENTGGYSSALASTGTRGDSASYLTGSGAIFDWVVPVFFSYSRSSPVNGAVARHIYDAQTNPGSTYPPLPGKTIPGAVGSGKPLTRLYPLWDDTASARYTRNRAVARAACAKLRRLTNPPPKYQCDEYPFASTWQGAGAGNGDYSVRYVPGYQNSSAGGELSAWYDSQRLLERDLFFVSIQP